MEVVEKKINVSQRFPHGRSIKWPRVYRALRRQGKSKSTAAAISNAHWNKYRRWGKAGMPGPKSMAERQRQRRINKMLGLGDVHVNTPMDDGPMEWSDEHLTVAEIERIAQEAVETWEVQEDGTVVEKHGGSSHDQKTHGRRGDGRDTFFDGPTQGEERVAAKEEREGIPVGVISSYLTPGVVDAVSKASRALWKKGGETRIIVMSSFDDTPAVKPSWAGAHFAGKQILLNDKALSDFVRNERPEDVTYLTNHELAHSADAGGRTIRSGGYLSNTKYKEMIDRWASEFKAGGEGEWASYMTETDLDREWRYATGYIKRGDRLSGRAELFAEAVSYAVTPHKRKVLEDTDRRWREGSEKAKKWATPEQLAKWTDPPSIVADVQKILRDLGLEEEMRKSRHTGKYGATMTDMGGDGIVETHIEDDDYELRKLRFRLRHGGLSILKRQVGTKRNGGGGQQPYDEFGRWTSGGRISTVPPKGKEKGADKPHPMKDLRRMSVDQAMKDDPEIATKWMEKLSSVAGFEDLRPDASDDAKKVKGYVHKAIQRIKQNILDIHDRADLADAKRWGEWYPIANKLGEKWAKESGDTHPDAVYAVMARLSPQADWNDNMTMAREVVKLLHEDPVVSKDILKAHRTLQLKQAEMYGKEPDAPLPQDFIGKRLSELSDLDAGKMVRAISDARGPLQVIDHEEKLMFKEDGDPRYVRWQSNDNLMRSVSIFRTPTFENISQMMGEQHKIRAFYNNIRDPHDTEFDDVTVDTHAYGIGMGIPVTTASTEISNAKGSITLPGAPKSTKAGTVGIYPIFAEAYREAAKERGMLGRRMQSITWEQWRKEWSPKARSPWMVDTARNIQHAAAKGEIDREESWKLLAEFRRQLPGASGGGTNKEENITGDATRYVPSRYDGKIDKAVKGTKANGGGGQQPYDEHGRYASSRNGPLADYDEQLGFVQSVFEDKEVFKKYQKKYDTSITEVDKDGNWKPERRKLHREILDDVLREYAEVPAERKAIFTGGLGGSGKTHALKKNADRLGIKWDNDRNAPANFVIVSADDLKERIAAKGAGPKVPGMSPAEASVFSHEEGSYLSKRLADIAQERGLNVIWDYTMGSMEANEQRARPLIEKGYKVKAIFIDVSTEQSVKGATKRHRSGHERFIQGEDAFGGRYVPTWARPTNDGASMWRSGNREAFEGWKRRPYVSGYMTVDNEGFQGKLIEDEWKEW